MATTTNSSNPSSSSSSSAQEVKTAELFDDHRYSADDNNMSPMLSPQFDVGLLDGQNTLSLVPDSTQWRDLLATGSRVDAQDGDSMWYESIIEESSSDSVTVRFLGWSRKWNALLPRDSRRIALRNTKVPNWRQTLTPGKCVEVSTSDSCTWCTAVVSVVAPTKFQVIRAPACTTEWHDINSPLIAEPYTHCGYKIEADARERRRMLAARRNLFNVELQICDGVRAMSSRIRVAQHLGEHLLGIYQDDGLGPGGGGGGGGGGGSGSGSGSDGGAVFRAYPAEGIFSASPHVTERDRVLMERLEAWGRHLILSSMCGVLNDDWIPYPPSLSSIMIAASNTAASPKQREPFDLLCKVEGLTIKNPHLHSKAGKKYLS